MSKIKKSKGAKLIAKARKQQQKEHWPTDYRGYHTKEELAWAAACYAMPEEGRVYTGEDIPAEWPFAREVWEPSEDRIKELAKAGAFIAAEIDRILEMREALEEAVLSDAPAETKNEQLAPTLCCHICGKEASAGNWVAGFDEEKATCEACHNKRLIRDKIDKMGVLLDRADFRNYIFDMIDDIKHSESIPNTIRTFASRLRLFMSGRTPNSALSLLQKQFPHSMFSHTYQKYLAELRKYPDWYNAENWRHVTDFYVKAYALRGIKNQD